MLIAQLMREATVAQREVLRSPPFFADNILTERVTESLSSFGVPLSLNCYIFLAKTLTEPRVGIYDRGHYHKGVTAYEVEMFCFTFLSDGVLRLLVDFDAFHALVFMERQRNQVGSDR